MKKTVLVLITFALVIAVAGSGFWLVHYFIDSKEQRETYETLAEEFVLESTPTPESNTPAKNSSPTENSSEPAESVSLTTAPPRHDLAALAEENADCVGWLTIPDTGIDYPVMHTPNDPEHYLRRDFYGNSASGGTPFLDGRNLAEAENQNLILYGHNMMDGSMFKPLISYLEPNFRESHKDIFLELNGKQYRYEVLEAANSVRRCDSEFRRYYDLKFKEVNKYQHKRALALTARKLVRLVFRLLKDNRLYIPPEG